MACTVLVIGAKMHPFVAPMAGSVVMAAAARMAAVVLAGASADPTSR